MELDLPRAMETARRAVTAASRAALRHFGGPLEVAWKSDRSPVTRADRESEEAILEEIRRDFPGHGVLAEESGEHAGDGESRWIVDPLDGTRGFSRGGSFWGPIVGLEHRGEIVAGAVALPALGETYWAARGLGCFRDGVVLRVSDVASLEDATVSLGELKNLLGGAHAAGVGALIRSVASCRSFGDVAGCAMLLAGRADLWLEAGVRIWDVAGLEILVKEAGGRFTDFDGAPGVAGVRALASNGRLHDPAVAVLNQT